MKIVYDGHVFRWYRPSGISRYFEELITRLPQDWVPTVIGVEDTTRNLPRHPRLAVSVLSGVRPRRYTQLLKNKWWDWRHFRTAQVFHPTYYGIAGGIRPADIQCPMVLTVYDFIHATYPRQMEGAESTIRHQGQMIARADHVICISRATERQLWDRYPQAAHKTSVIHLGSSFAITAPPSVDPLEKPTFLYVGGRDGYKNFLFLLRAFAKACQSDARLRLRVVGPELNHQERWQMHFLGMDDRVDVSIHPDQQQLQQYYRECVALLYPSRHEGFGIPPLEAMACGTVAVTANVTSLPEVVGDGGLMLDPDRETDWTEAIRQLSNGAIQRREIITRAQARAALFTWDDTARQHIQIYQKFT